MRVVSWNVLADAYADPGYFPGSPVALLSPGSRHELVLRQVRRFAADVVAVQEADENLARAAADLPGYRCFWAPKDGGKPDGCLTVVRQNVQVVSSATLVYDDGDPVSGHTAQLITVIAGDTRFTIANTHVKWAGFDTAPDTHVGVRQVRELVKVLGSGPAVVCADLNDRPGGPVRQVLADAGFNGADDDRATSLFNGVEPRALDVVATRGVRATARRVPPVVGPLPVPGWASDHVAVVALLGV